MRYKTLHINLGCQIFKALSDTARLRILYLLFKAGEMCISDMEQTLDFTQTKTSRHVTYLKNSGILTYKKKDQWIYYYIKDEYMGIVNQLIGIFEKDNELKNDMETYRTLYANNILAKRKIHNRLGIYELPDL